MASKEFCNTTPKEKNQVKNQDSQIQPQESKMQINK